jgi:hypothetical protein
MREAVAHERSFNAIHFDSVFKIDIFVASSNEFALAQLDRRELRRISTEGKGSVYVATAEDTIIAKLQWYRAGNKTSNTQWNDVLGILATSRDSLDFDYLRKWAHKLDLSELIQKALEDVEEDSAR